MKNNDQWITRGKLAHCAIVYVGADVMHNKKEVQVFYDFWFRPHKKRKAEYEYVEKWKRMRLRMAIMSFLDECSGDMVLDLGCGAGHLTDLLTKRFRIVVGIDISRVGVRTAWKHSRLKERCNFILADIFHLPFKRECFDVVVMSEVIEHVHDQTKALKEANRFLKSQGHFILTTPNRLHRDITKLIYKCAFKSFVSGQIIENQLHPRVLRSLVSIFFKIEKEKGVMFTVPCIQRVTPVFLLPLRILLSETLEDHGFLPKMAYHQCLLCSRK